MNQKALTAIVGVLILLAVIIGGVFLFNGSPSGAQSAAVGLGVGAENPEDIEPTVPQTSVISEGWRGYENAQFRFSVHFPEGLQAREYREAGGAMSVVFENPQTGEGFQIYVTPYAEKQITKERFRLDNSSGVMEEPTDILIAGVPATMFFSKNAIMGDTREVWFIKDGLLYEVVSYKELDTWLGTIMQTWKFL